MKLGELKEYAKAKAFDTISDGKADGSKMYVILESPFDMSENEVKNILKKISNNHMYGDTMKNWEDLGKLVKAFEKDSVIPDTAEITYEVLRKSDSLDSYKIFAADWGKKRLSLLVNMTGCGKYAIFDSDERRDLPIVQYRSLSGVIKKLNEYEILHL